MIKPKRPGANTKKKRDVRTKRNNPTYLERPVKKPKEKTSNIGQDKK